jgi:hypothetical protein
MMRRLGATLRERIARLREPPDAALVPAHAAPPPATSLRTHEQSVVVVPLDERDVMPERVSPVELFASLAEAKAARDTRSDGSGIATGLAIGLSVVAVVGLGVMLCYVLFRKRDQEQLSGPVVPQPVPMPYPYYVPQLAAPPAPTAPSVTSPAEQVLDAIKNKHRAKQDMRTLMRSYALPNINTPRTQPVRIAEAGALPYDVGIRVVSPAGAQAIIALDPNELNGVGIPIGNVMLMAAGQRQVIRIGPRQALYAKGTTAPPTPTILSVNGANAEIDVDIR